MNASIFRRYVVLMVLTMCGASVHAAISCNFSVRNLGELFRSTGANGVEGDLRVSCTRTSLSDPTTVYYSIAANYGLNSTGGESRNVRNPVSSTNLLWVLRRGAVGNSTDWGTAAAPGLLTGLVNFSPGAFFLNTTFSGAYSMNVRGAAGGSPNSNLGTPAPGAYVDTVTLTPSLSSTAITGPFNLPAPPTTQLAVSVGVGALCVVRKQGADLFFNYSPLGAAQQQFSEFKAVCSATLAYSVSVSPASGTIVGINYTAAMVGADLDGILRRTGSGGGSAGVQDAHVRVTVGANQVGSCNPTCTGSAVHTVTITY